MAEQLQSATKDDYHRKSSKKARYRPQYKDKPAAGKPIIETASQNTNSGSNSTCNLSPEIVHGVARRGGMC